MNQALLDQTIRRAVYLEGLKQSEVDKFAKFLREMDAVLRLKLTTTDLTEYKRARFESYLSEVGLALGELFTAFYEQLMGALDDIALAESAFEIKSLQAAVTGATLTTPTTTALQRVVSSRPMSAQGVQGKLLKPFLQEFIKTETDRIVGVIRQGVFTGQTNSEMIRALRGTKALRYNDGALAITERNADAIVRTAVQHVSNQARNETWRTNTDIIIGVRIVATLDSRTSATCRALDGRVFKVDQGPRPPFHVRCRTTTIAVLDPKYAGKPIDAKRASVNGVVSDQSYYEWLKSQPVAFQGSVLGVDRAKLLRDGGLSAERFAALQLDRNFKPLTLDQMRELEPTVFARAGV